MALSPGDRLGHYVITAPLGAGGMGEVYRATDSRLGRDVAIKVLSDEFAADAERLARFEREATVLASLNHPNIATLFGLETVAEPDAEPRDRSSTPLSFLVMELVEGEDLEERISGRALPIAQAVKIARQIAVGLEAAHHQNIIHRDLKPANIRIATDGTVKILDFGLAKTRQPTQGTVDLDESPTLTAEMTIQGAILGTAPYLSPEQARGESLDRRSDIWSFGCVLFEMLTGRRAFAGGTSTEVLAHILERDPDWSSLPTDIPPGLRRLLFRCLEKDSQNRRRDAGDLAIALEDIGRDGSPRTEDRNAGGPRRGGTMLPWLVAGIAVLVGVVGWLGGPNERKSNFQPTVRFTEISPVDIDIVRNHHSGSAIAISPDGHVLVWVGATETSTQLWSRHLDESKAHPVSGTVGAQAPFFSPDGDWIGFWADGKLKKVSVRGGAPQTICETEHIHGPSWGEGVIVLAAVGDGSLFSVDPGGGKLQPIRVKNGTGYYTGDFPRLLPDSRSFFASSLTTNSVDLVSLDSDESTVLVDEGSNASYLSSGHLVWAQDDSLLAAPFDLASRSITGGIQTVIDGVLSESHIGVISHYAVSDEGTLVFLPGGSHGSGASPVWVRFDGTTQSMPIPAGSYFSPRVSPDGRRILLARRSGTQTIWLAESDRGFIGPVTGDKGNDFWAIWTPDGSNIIYNSQLGTNPSSDLWEQPVDSNAPPKRLTTVADSHQPPFDITQDGRTVIFGSTNGNYSDLNIHLLQLGTEPAHVPLLDSGADEIHPALSPDEQWLAYASDVTGELEVYVQRFPNLGGTVRISSNGGQEPKWSPSGDRLYFRSPDGRSVFVVDVLGGDPLRFGREELLFEGNFDPGPRWGFKWDIHPDGDRFLMLQVEDSENPREIRVVSNWFTELERLVPTSN